MCNIIGGQLGERLNAFLATCHVAIYIVMLLLVILEANKMMMMMMMIDGAATRNIHDSLGDTNKIVM